MEKKQIIIINSCKELWIKANYEIRYQDLLTLVTCPLALLLKVVKSQITILYLQNVENTFYPIV